MEINKQLMKGSLTTLVLQLLSKKSMYGYEISTHLQKISDGKVSITEGTLYPMLHSLLADEAVSAQMLNGRGKRKRKVYSITETGEKILQKKTKEWLDFQQIMGNLMAFNGPREFYE